MRLRQCPLCDGPIKIVYQDLDFKFGQENPIPFTVKNVKTYHCLRCKDYFYGSEANRKIDAVMLRIRKDHERAKRVRK